jgi:hypothetical protein
LKLRSKHRERENLSRGKRKIIVFFSKKVRIGGKMAGI